jgi:hypothetical protein
MQQQHCLVGRHHAVLMNQPRPRTPSLTTSQQQPNAAMNAWGRWRVRGTQGNSHKYMDCLGVDRQQNKHPGGRTHQLYSMHVVAL